MTVKQLLKYGLVFGGLCLLSSALAIQDGQIAPPDVKITDRFGVNMSTGQVTATQQTVSIGGERGLSHSISIPTNHFPMTGLYGPTDKYAGNAKYTMISNPDVPAGFSYQGQSYTYFSVMRVFGPVGSEDFLIYVGTELKYNHNDVTSGFHYVAMGDTRNSLEVSADTNHLIWTTPDGTELYYARLGVPRHAGSPAYLRNIIYPNGLTLNIDQLAGVTSNTGFQLKYDYPTDHRGLTSAKQNELSGPGTVYHANPAIPGVEPHNWSGRNPKYVIGINRAVDYCPQETGTLCNTSVQACQADDPNKNCQVLSQDWPRATFDWPAGMPQVMFIGENTFTATDADGGVTEYHYQAQDVMIDEFGVYYGYSPQYYLGQRWSPRLVGVKSPGSNVIDRQYQYKNHLTPHVITTGEGGGIDVAFVFHVLESEAGIVTNASGLDGVAGYQIGQPAAGGAVYDNVSDGRQPMRVRPQTGVPGSQEFIDFHNGVHNVRVYHFDGSFRNFVTMHNPIGAPARTYHYNNRNNLVQIAEYDETTMDGRFAMQAEYPASCNTSNRKTCNKPFWVKDARGNQTDYTYHPESGQVATVTGPAPVAGGVRPQTRYEYSALYAWYKKDSDNIVAADTPVWLLTRESTCRTTATVGDACAGGAVDEVVTEYDYGPQDGTANNLWLQSVSVTAEVDGTPQTRTSCYEYDSYGHRIGETLPEGTAGGCSTSVPQQPAPHKYAKRYNPAGQLLGEISPDPDGDGQDFPAIRYTYNSRGLLTQVETGILAVWQDDTLAPASWSGFTVIKQTLSTYDSYGRKISDALADPGGNKKMLSQTAYDTGGRVLCQTVRLNPAQAPANACTLGPEGSYGPDRITRFEYNFLDSVLTETRAVGTALEQLYAEYTYTSENQIDTVTDANRNTAKFDYDGYGRKTKWCFPVQTKSAEAYNCNDFEEYAYDENGNRTSLRKRDGKIIGYQYDALNRMTYKNIPGTSSGDVYYGYELTGVQTFARFGSPTGQGISTHYTGFGEPETDTVNLGGVTRTITRQFDDNGNRTRITHPDHVQSTNDRFFVYQYDGLDRLETLLENGGAFLISDAYDVYERPDSRATAGSALTALTYDSASRLASIDYQFSGVADDLHIGFGFNPAGQLVDHNLSNAVYDHTGSIGNTGAYTVNGLNQYQSVNGAAFTYDDNGNLTSDGTRSYTYDVENRLITVSGTSPALSATLSYDPMGRLYRYTANGTTTDFVYDGDSLILEYRSGAVHARYVHGTAVDTPLVQYSGATVGPGNRQFLHKNHQGSVIAISDNSGNVIAKNTYDAYGVPASGNVGRFGYTGQMYLSELGLYHYRARVYNPHIGRFLQTDPIGYEDQINLYAYVHNDPVNYVDITGEEAYLALKLIVGVAIADAATPEPSDAAAPAKVFVYGSAIVGTAIGGTITWGLDKVFSESSKNSDTGDGESSTEEQEKEKRRDVPNRAEPGQVIEGKRRTREYNSEGKPKRDYDKGHQGNETDHVHEWEDGVREEPGRPYSPINN